MIPQNWYTVNYLIWRRERIFYSWYLKLGGTCCWSRGSYWHKVAYRIWMRLITKCRCLLTKTYLREGRLLERALMKGGPKSSHHGNNTLLNAAKQTHNCDWKSYIKSSIKMLPFFLDSFWGNARKWLGWRHSYWWLFLGCGILPRGGHPTSTDQPTKDQSTQNSVR